MGMDKKSDGIAELIEIMAALRTPGSGCPWDLEQDFKSIAPYTIEEAYEVADAIARNNMADLKEELGDLLFQVVYHARMAEEQELFQFADVVGCICDKMVRRHPHVFAGYDLKTSGDVNLLWDEIKAAERADKSSDKSADKSADNSADVSASIFDDVPFGLPALSRAVKLQKRAARVGFDWDALGPVFDKLEEEMGELSEAVSVGSHAEIEDEFGDVLFALGNLARHLDLDPEAALRKANQKFTTRMDYMERALKASGSSLDAAGKEEMEHLWNEAKKNGSIDPAQ